MADDKRKHKGSKKSKRSWRKHTDVADVEEHLEEERRDERTGGAVSEKGNDSLFFVDKESKAVTKDTKGETAKHDDDDDDDDENVYISRKEKMMKKLIEEHNAEQRKTAQKANSKVQNIWGQEVMKVENDFLEPTVKRAKVKPPTVGVGKSNLDAVILPKPGASYNPDFESHQELLNDAHQEELKDLIKRQKLNEKVKMVSVAELKKRSKEWIKEMSAGLFDTGKDSEGDSTDGENEVEIPQISNNPKTLKQRRKERVKKELEQQMKIEKKEKAKHQDIYSIKRFKKEIREEDDVSSQRKKRNMEKLNPDKTKRLGKQKYSDGKIAVQLSEELSGSLRELKPEGNLLEDRFKSLQKRNVIETRKPVIPKRRYKRKLYERRSRNTKTIKEFNSKT